ncbi:hypothetical protein AB0K53_32255 [Streptomyces tuirus]|uniref:hypothetical protein n=1 Tax=Streptomyces tuirus TaxID=68278 RepID=UPI00342152F1
MQSSGSFETSVAGTSQETARQLVRFIASHRERETPWPVEHLRATAPFVVLMQRRIAILSSAAAERPERIVDGGPGAELGSWLSEAALESGDLALAQLLDWSSKAWEGRGRTDLFRTVQALPAPLTHQLAETVDGTSSGTLLNSLGSGLLRKQAEKLRDLTQSLAGTDRAVTQGLFVQPVANLLSDVADGRLNDYGLLSHSPEELVAGVVRFQQDQQSFRHRQLVKATTEVVAQVERLLELADAFPWEAPRIPRPEDLFRTGLDATLASVLTAALDHSEIDSPRTDDGASLLPFLAQRVLEEADPLARPRVALVVRHSGIPPHVLNEALAPLERLREQARALASPGEGPGSEDLLPLRSLVMEALARGDLEDAEQGIDMLAEAREEMDLARRLETCRETLSDQTEEDLDLRTAERYLKDRDLRAAARYLNAVEQRLGRSAPRERGPAAGQAGGPAGTPPPPLEDSVPSGTTSAYHETVAGSTLDTRLRFSDTVVDDPSEALRTRILASRRFDATPATVAEAQQALHQLAQSGDDEAVHRTARQLLQVDPRAAAELLERSELRFAAALRPMTWHLLEQALQSCGEYTRAEKVFHLGHPPLPPEDLSLYAAEAGVLPLEPRLGKVPRSFAERPAMAELIDAVALHDAPRAARAYAEARAAGFTSALGPAVGWHVLAGRSTEGLDVYRRYGRRQYLNASAAWNIACAYAAVGLVGHAVESLKVMYRILPGKMSREQLDSVTSFCAQHGVQSPLAAAAPQPTVQHSAGGSQTSESLAKHLYESGRTEDAARLLEQVLGENASSPGAFLMLRICRESGDLARARAVITRIGETPGALVWRHYVELARTALDPRCLDTVVARNVLNQARALGAPDTWTGPLEQRLRAMTDSGSSSPAAGSGVVTTGTGDPKTAHGETLVFRTLEDRLRAGGLLDALWEARATSGQGGITISDIVSGLRNTQTPIPNGLPFAVLLEDVEGTGDDYLVREVSYWLLDGGRAGEAAELLQRCVSWTPPEKLPRMLLLRDRAAREAGMPNELLPKRPPRMREAGARQPAARRELKPRTATISGPVATEPGIRLAQQPPPGSTLDYIADAWAAAVRDHPVALANALGYLVLAGRPEDALHLHDQWADTLWLTAGAAWNLGCAYAATGQLHAAATTFEYCLRVLPRQPSPDQQAALDDFFTEIGRKVPEQTGLVSVRRRTIAQPDDARGSASSRPASSSPSVQHRSLAEAEVEAARLIAQCRSAPSVSAFRNAADAVRKAMRLGDVQEAGRYVPIMRELFSLTPDAATAAGLAMVLEAAQRPGPAWELLTEWIERTQANFELLAPAVRVARVLGRAQELRALLEPYHSNDAHFEFHLSLAKLSQQLGAREDLGRYAELALMSNPTCAEAAILRKAAGPLPSPGRAADRVVRDIVDQGLDRRQTVRRLKKEYTSTLDDLRVRALARFQPPTSPTALRNQLPGWAKEEAQDLLEAAANEEWELASDHALELVARKPRYARVSTVAAVCLINAERDEEARTVASLIGSRQDRQEVLVYLACARREYAEAVRLLSVSPVWYSDQDQLLAHAGLLTDREMADMPVAAVELLLLHARLDPRRSSTPAALAAVLADEAGERSLVAQALDLLRQPTPPPGDVLVDTALAAGTPEALNSGVQPLTEAQLQRVYEFLEDDPVRLHRFLSGKVRRSQGRAAQKEATTRALLLGTACARRGQYRTAVAAFERALKSGAPYHTVCSRLAGAFEEAGLPDPHAYADQILAGRVAEAAAEPSEKLASLVSATKELLRSPKLGDHLKEVGDALAECAVGGLDAAVSRSLARCWQQQWQQFQARPTSRASAETLEDHTVETESRIRTGEALIPDLSEPLGVHAKATQDALRAVWDDYGRDQLLSGATSSEGSVTLRRSTATRLSNGPVELQLVVRAGRDLRDTKVTVLGHERSLGELKASNTVGCFLAVPASDRELTVELSGTPANGDETETALFTVQVKQLVRQEAVVSKFRPGEPAVPGMFVGRTSELERLRTVYADAHRHSVPSLVMMGSRRAGKTSIIHELMRMHSGAGGELLTPAEWRIPRALTVLVDGQETNPGSAPMLQQIANSVLDRIEDVYGRDLSGVELPGDNSVNFRRWWRRLRREVWPNEEIALLIVVDEFQELLNRYPNAQAKANDMGVLRALKLDGTLALLFSGSCTTEQLRQSLEGTLSQQDFSQPMRIGPLDRQATLQIVHQGFDNTVQVLASAAELVYDKTRGHPQHVHMMGKRLAELLEQLNRTVIDQQLVDEAGEWVRRQRQAVLDIADPYASGARIPDLFFKIDSELDTDPDELQVRRALTEEERRQLDDYLDYGLLVLEGNCLSWANGIVQGWLKEQSGPPEEDPDGMHPHERELRTAGYQVQDRISPSDKRSCVVVHRDDPSTKYIAKYYPEADRNVLREITRVLGGDAYEQMQGVPPRWEVRGSWLVYERVNGFSLGDHLVSTPSIDPVKAARWVLMACWTLQNVWENQRMSHGDIRPANLILSGDAQNDNREVFVVGWGYGCVSAGPEPRPLLTPQGSRYYRSAMGDGDIRGPEHDARALVAVLYELVHPEHQLPLKPDNSVDAEALVRDDLPGVPPAMQWLLKDALHPHSARRYRSPSDLAEALINALPAELGPREAPPGPSEGHLNEHAYKALPVFPSPSPPPVINYVTASARSIQEDSMTDSSIKIERSTLQGNAIGHKSKAKVTNTSSVGPDATAEKQDLGKLVAELRAEIERIHDQMDGGDANDVVTTLERLEGEVQNEQPNPGRVARLAGFLRDTLETVAGAATAFTAATQIVEAVSG